MSSSTPSAASAFEASFEKVFGLVLEEWPEVGVDALRETGGGHERVVSLVAERTGRTKALVKRQLDELVQVASEAAGDARESEKRAPMDELKALVERLEKKSHALVDFAKDDLPKEAREQIEKNLWASLLIALGLGFILGLLTGGGRR